MEQVSFVCMFDYLILSIIIGNIDASPFVVATVADYCVINLKLTFINTKTNVTARNWKQLPMLSFTFFIEKMAYVYWWIRLMQTDQIFSNSLKLLTSGEDVLTGGFMLAFGANDFLFGLAFGYGAWKSMQGGVTSTAGGNVNKTK